MRFDCYHPMINLIYFVVAIAGTNYFNHPVFLVISFLCAFIYSVKLRGVKTLILNLVLTVLGMLYANWYAFYNHFGVTNLKANFIGNQITLEALIYGGVRGITVVTMIMWLLCVFKLITADKVVFLFGCVSPRLSLFLTILLRTLPRVRVRSRCIETSREGIGKGVKQGNVIKRILHLFGFLSILITWTLEDFVESSKSMKSRGYSLKGRTAFSIYRFDNRDRSLVIGFFFCIMLLIVAILFNQVRILYNPEIVMNRITPVSYVFYVAYAVFLLLPMVLQIIGEYRFKRAALA